MGNLNSNYEIAQQWRLRLQLCCKIQFPFCECNFCGKCNPGMWTCFVSLKCSVGKKVTRNLITAWRCSAIVLMKKCIKFRIINQRRSGTNRSWNVNYFFMNRVQLAAISFFAKLRKVKLNIDLRFPRPERGGSSTTTQFYKPANPDFMAHIFHVICKQYVHKQVFL